eukprot:841792-Amphidinium_carterae.3
MASTETPQPPPEEDELDFHGLEVFGDAWSQLELLAASEPSEAEVLQEHFIIKVLGGNWNIERAGRRLFGMRTDIKPTSDIWTFADNFGLHKSASFEHELYGEVPAHTLCLLWQKRIMQIFDVWVSAESPASMSALTIPDMVPSESDTVALSELPARGQTRLKAIPSMRPAGCSASAS